MKKWIFTLFMAGLFLSVAAQSYHTITIDGNNDFNVSGERMETTSDTALYAYVTWDTNYIYFGFSGSSPAGKVTDGNRVYHIYIDTDPQTTLKSGNGTDDGLTWRWDPTLPFYADYHYAFKTVDNTEYKNYYSSGSWNGASFTTSNWKGSGYWELSISQTDIGSPDAINVVMYVEEDWSGGSICGGLPSNLFTNTSTQGAITFNDYWKGYQLKSGITPNDDVYDNRRFVSGSETISTSETWSGLTILPGATLTIDPSGSLMIDGDLVNDGTASQLVIQSSSSGTGSLIFFSGTPSATVQRYMTTYTTDDNGWHLLSTPVTGFTISGSDFAPGTDEDLYEFDETASSQNWLNYNGGTFGDSEFQLQKGYLVAYKSGTTNPKTFTGNLTSGNQSAINLSYTSSSSYPGWNLVGNPFTSAIDWDNITKTTNVNGTVYVLRASDGTYISWNGSTGNLTDGIIPAMQGFFVNTDRTGESITITSGSQVHSSIYYKSNKLAPNTFVVSLNSDKTSNETFVQFRDDATESFDMAIDGYKLFGLGSTPEIYSKTGETLYSINCLPSNLGEYDLLLGTKIQKSGKYSLSFKGFDTFVNKTDITLVDLKTGESVNLESGLEYQFVNEDGDNPDRFILHFYGVNGINNFISADNRIIVFVSGKTVTVKSPENKLMSGKIFISNMLGQTVFEKDFLNSSNQNFSTNLTRGVYIVNIRLNNGLQSSRKIIIE